MLTYLEVPAEKLAEVFALDVEHCLVDLELLALTGDSEVGEDTPRQVLHIDEDRVASWVGALVCGWSDRHVELLQVLDRES